MAESESEVSSVMLLAMTRMIKACRSPALPTTQPVRRNMITPRMVSTLGVKTPPKVPNLRAEFTLLFEGVVIRQFGSRCPHPAVSGQTHGSTSITTASTNKVSSGPTLRKSTNR